MNKKNLENFIKKYSSLGKRVFDVNTYKSNYVFLSIFVILTTALILSYSTSIKKKRLEEINSFLAKDETILLKNYILNQIKSPYLEYDYVVKSNDTVESILKKFSVNKNEISFIVKKIKKRKLSNISPNQKMKFVLRRSKDKTNMEVLKIQYPISKTTYVNIDKGQDGLEVTKNVTQLFKKEVVVNGKISNNLYSSAVKSGMEPNIIIEFARIFGFEVDFQRDIRKGDWFEILYERFEDDNNIVQDTGKIIYASMFVNGAEINLYNFKDGSGDIGFYDLKGKSIVKSLMKTPINGARLSSSYGMRKHPILGYNKMHRGTDFAAPSGTPIMASGAGKVIRARWCGGGGNCVKIKHNSTYQTVYAHMKSFARGIKEGRRVKQGQIIGYVGSTGMSTGPHLHYEVIVNGKKVNSQKLKLPSGKILKGKTREEFELARIKIDLKLSELR